jgi:pimeloyl-ACP methyl ester carboxylesterase
MPTSPPGMDWRSTPIWSRLICPEFGQSERRESLMSPKAMGEFMVLFGDAFGLEHPHVVAQDVGIAASLFAAALHPKRLRSLVVGTGGSAFPFQLGGVLKECAEAPSLEATW